MLDDILFELKGIIMPKCFECNRETPTTRMILVREYRDNTGNFWYFCSWWHLIAWLDKRFMKERGDNKLREGTAHLGRAPMPKGYHAKSP